MIEQYNKQIIAGMTVRLYRNESIRGHINYSIIERLREHYEMNGFPTDEDYKRHIAKIKIAR